MSTLAKDKQQSTIVGKDGIHVVRSRVKKGGSGPGPLRESTSAAAISDAVAK